MDNLGIYFANKIKNFNSNLTISEYSIKFAKIFDIDIIDKEKIDTEINKSPSLFPQFDYINTNINNGNIFKVLNFFNILSTFDEFNQLYSNNSENSLDINILLKNLIFLPEKILNNNKESYILTYLYLYFMPNKYKNSLLYHPINQDLLITYHGITNENFDMLWFLMNEFEKDEYNKLNRNLNHLLIENSLKNNLQSHFYDKSLDWTKILPIYKIEKLLKYNLRVFDFENKMSKIMIPSFKGIQIELDKIEKIYYINCLDNTIKVNNDNKKLSKI